MKVIFCIPGSNFSKNFLQCWTNLVTYCIQNGIQFGVSFAESNNIYMVRNKCLGADVSRGKDQKPFDGKIDYDYLMLIDSDMVFTPQQFQVLLNRCQDIISGYYSFEGGNGLTCGKWDMDFQKANGYMPFYTEETLKKEPKNESELVEIDYSGLGFMLVKKGIFEEMEYPWFRPKMTEYEKDNIKIQDFSMEDVYFCMKAKEL